MMLIAAGYSFNNLYTDSILLVGPAAANIKSGRLVNKSISFTIGIFAMKTCLKYDHFKDFAAPVNKGNRPSTSFKLAHAFQ